MKQYNITVNGNTYEVTVEEVSGATSAPAAAPVATPAPKAVPAKKASGAPVNAPMPGTILDVKVKPGQSVKKGDVMFILEAMKMENDIPAPADGVVGSVSVQKGSTVNTGDALGYLN